MDPYCTSSALEIADMKRRPKIVIVQMILPHYRRPFCELLRERLAEINIDLVLVYGSFSESEVLKKDNVEIAWVKRIKNRSLKIGRYELYWQPCLSYLSGADLVIVEQASKLILNYVLFAGQLLGIKKLGFWGHGKNFQEHNASAIGEGIKCYMSRHVHWWFAYNDLSAGIIQSLGYPANRITSVQNAIDTQRLVTDQHNITQSQLRHIRVKLGIKGDNICIYTGGMYAEKRLRFLLEACVKIKNDVKDFEMIFVGEGPEDKKIKEAAQKHKWIHYVGPRFGEEKVPYFMISKLFLMPASVGLSVLDTFVFGTPLITTNNSGHGPEIDYLNDGVNGVMVGGLFDSDVYAAQVVNLLKDDKAREKLIAGCRLAREKYTIEEMVERFAEGIIRALDYPHF